MKSLIRSRLALGAALAVLLAGGVAFAKLNPGQKVFVKAKNTKLLAKPEANSQVREILQPGDEVAWESGPEAKEFHRIKSPKNTEGYVFFSNLALERPKPEIFTGGTTKDARAFASSGAATRALAEGAIRYGDKKLNDQQAVAAVVTMEAIAAQVSAGDAAKLVAENGLIPAVGEKEKK